MNYTSYPEFQWRSLTAMSYNINAVVSSLLLHVAVVSRCPGKMIITWLWRLQEFFRSLTDPDELCSAFQCCVVPIKSYYIDSLVAFQDPSLSPIFLTWGCVLKHLCAEHCNITITWRHLFPDIAMTTASVNKSLQSIRIARTFMILQTFKKNLLPICPKVIYMIEIRDT